MKKKLSKVASAALSENVVRVGLLGLGTVGSGVAEILTRHSELIAQRAGVHLQLVRALVREPRRKRSGAARQVALTEDAQDIVNAPDIDIVVELLGGIKPAYPLMLQALKAGKPVVTANKAVVALHHAELLKAAAATAVDIYFEATVAGGVPIIRTLREGLAADRITRVCGILNGTTNFMLGRLDVGETYEQALAQAQRLGFAEADPTLDVSGRDAADKLAILVHLAFGTHVVPSQLPTEGITHLTPEVLADARELGFCVKLLATAQRVTLARGGEGIDARVHPALLPMQHPLSAVPASQNAIVVHSDALGSTLYQGAGAGSLPTGSAVVGDLIEAVRNMKAGVSGRLAVQSGKSVPTLIKEDAIESAFYLRLLVDDQPGVLAAVTKILAAHKISMASVLQRGRGAGPVPLVITTHTTTTGAMHKALQAIKRLRSMHATPNVVRLAEADPSGLLE